MSKTRVINTPDQRLRVFVSSTMQELAAERQAVRDAVTQLRLVPVMFELGARPHPPRPVYRAYLTQSQVFAGIYWQSYGWVAPGEQVSGLEDEYRLSAGLPRLLYVKSSAPERDPRLTQMLARIRDDGEVSYQHFSAYRTTALRVVGPLRRSAQPGVLEGLPAAGSRRTEDDDWRHDRASGAQGIRGWQRW
jgi:hypothetical protein